MTTQSPRQILRDAAAAAKDRPLTREEADIAIQAFITDDEAQRKAAGALFRAALELMKTHRDRLPADFTEAVLGFAMYQLVGPKEMAELPPPAWEA
jgi:hypothetical protein